MTFRDTLINNYSWLQYSYTRGQQSRRYSSLAMPAGGWPILLGISFPKSGTNLLRQVLAAFTQAGPFADRSFDVFAAFNAKTGAALNGQDALSFMKRLKPGDVAAAHFHTWPEAVEEAPKPRYLPYFMYRDPRDVVVSHVFYVTDRAQEHAHHKYYREVLTNFDERLRTSILGRPEIDIDFPDIGKRFQPYIGWLDHPEVLSQRYEDYILNRESAIAQAVDHFMQRVDTLAASRVELIKIVEQNIVPEKSPTFRSGKTGEWQKHFKDEHKQLFKAAAGDILIRLGYEKDNNW
jgi:hypothetical protein